MSDGPEPSLSAKQKKDKSTRKKKAFEPYPVKQRNGKIHWQIYAGSKVVERDGKMVRILNRRTYADKGEAESAADLLRIQKINYGTAAMSLSERDRSDAAEALRVLKAHTVSILDAAHFYANHLEAQKKSRPVKDAVLDYIAAAQADGRAWSYILDLRYRLGRFSSDFEDKLLGEITTGDLDSWVRSLGLGAVSRNTFRKRLAALFNYGRARGWCTSNPAKDVVPARVRPTPIGILSPHELSRLLGNASEKTLPYWTIAAFGGVRSAELERLEWKDVHFESHLIEIAAHKSKTATKRFVRMEPVLEAWLEPYKNHRGPICLPNLRKLQLEDRRKAGITAWPSNALRHSYASYHLAHFRNAAQLALEMGHINANITFAHYRELVRPQEAERWWNIMPAYGANVVALTA